MQAAKRFPLRQSDGQTKKAKRLHINEVWNVVLEAQEKNVSMYKVAMLSTDGHSAGSSHYWQQKLNAMYFKRSKMSFRTEGPVRISACTDASVHSCRDTLLTIFYDFQSNTACYGVSQHLWPGKHVQAGDDIAVETEELEKILAKREQSRLATYKLAQALSRQLQLQTGRTLADFAVPEKLLPLITPGNPRYRTVTHDCKLQVDRHEEIDILQEILGLPVVALLVDQASTDMSLASFLSDAFFLVDMDYDPFHRLARDQRLASDHCGLAQAQLASQYLT